MSNELFNALNGNNAPINPSFFNMLNQFQTFRRNFTGNPEQMVKDMLRTGKMSQQQYEAICKPAQTLFNMLNK